MHLGGDGDNSKFAACTRCGSSSAADGHGCSTRPHDSHCSVAGWFARDWACCACMTSTAGPCWAALQRPGWSWRALWRAAALLRPGSGELRVKGFSRWFCCRVGQWLQEAYRWAAVLLKPGSGALHILVSFSFSSHVLNIVLVEQILVPMYRTCRRCMHLLTRPRPRQANEPTPQVFQLNSLY